MLKFTLMTDERYDLPISFSNDLDIGESIKSYSISLSNIEDIEEYEYVLDELEIYSTLKEKKLVIFSAVGIGDHTVEVLVETNRNRIISKIIDIYVDDEDIAHSYNDLNYRFFVDTNKIYIVFPYCNGLRFNNEYTVTVNSGIKGVEKTQYNDPYSFWFTSKYCPLYSTVTKIKLIAGPNIESFSDDTILRLIHKNSLEALSMVGGTKKLPINYYNCDGSRAPPEVIKYVECKTAYDLLAMLDALHLSGVSQTKTLGDMTIKYGGQAHPGKDLNPKKLLYDCFLSAMHMLSNIKWAVRGIDNYSKEYPHPVRDNTSNRVVNRFDSTNATVAGPWTKTGKKFPSKVI